MSSEEKKPFQRLPTDVVPRNYKIELRPDLEKFSFQGKLDISVEVHCIYIYIIIERAQAPYHCIVVSHARVLSMCIVSTPRWSDPLQL